MILKNEFINLGIAYIKNLSNNTFITITDIKGNVISSVSTGIVGFKNSKKMTPRAIQTVVQEASKRAFKKGIRSLSIIIIGHGLGLFRDEYLNYFNNNGINIITVSFKDKIAFNGCRLPKKRKL